MTELSCNGISCDFLSSERITAYSEAKSQSTPALFTGLQEQLGLRLLPTKGPVEVLVIDHIEKP
ncbi:MAG: TIGR03435 family protein, partial [Terracidiphilus sp.]